MNKIFCKSFILLMLGIMFPLMGQSTSKVTLATIKGTVKDAQSGKSLPGANVIVRGTSRGAATDLKGTYEIRNLPPGDYTLEFRYIGYRDLNKDVHLKRGESVVQDATMKFAALVTDEIYVTAQAEGQLEAINQQLASNTIRNVVSSTRIQELPDEDAARALSRLPGVSLRGQKVVIRGITPKMNKMLINGVAIPSTEFSDRSVDMGIISSNMLESIEVTKSITPDMDADAVGGTVNLRLREAPEEPHYDALLEGNYNDMHNSNENYKLWLSASRRFFDRKVGLFAQLNAKQLHGASDQLNASYSLSPLKVDELDSLGQRTNIVSSIQLRDGFGVNNTYGASLIADYQYESGKIVFSNIYSKSINENTSHIDVIDVNNSRRLAYQHGKNNKQLWSNALQGKQRLFFGSSFDYSLSHSFSSRPDEFSYEANTDITTRPYGSTGLSQSRKNSLTPQRAYQLINSHPDEPGGTIRRLIWNPLEAQERDLTGRFNVEIPVSFSKNISSNFKFGGKYTLKTRKADRSYGAAQKDGVMQPKTNPDALMEKFGIETLPELRTRMILDQDYDAGTFLGGEFDYHYAMNGKDIDWLIDLYRPEMIFFDYRNHSEDYEGSENLMAGYAMAELNLGSNLMIMPGVRYEAVRTEYEGNKVIFRDPFIEPQVTLQNSVRKNEHFFPMFHLRYKATDWFDVRAAYTQAISRPDYRLIVPRQFLSWVEARNVHLGNPQLKPALSENFDLFISIYNNTIGLFTIGGFYKEIEDMFYPIQEPLFEPLRWGLPPGFEQADFVHFSINSPDKGYVRGIEMDWQTHFWYLPSVFSSMVLNVNYTHMDSETRYPIVDEVTEIISVFPYQDTSYVRKRYFSGRLIDQGNDVANVAWGFDYKGLSTRLSFIFQGDVLTNLGGRPESNAHTEDLYRWDFTLKQKLPIDGLGLSFDAINLTNAPYETFEPTRNLRRSSRYSGTLYRIGLRYQLE